jgi:arabinogalactan oligomer/maltooligosaccharide transport system substrate-binding protein
MKDEEIIMKKLFALMLFALAGLVLIGCSDTGTEGTQGTNTTTTEGGDITYDNDTKGHDPEVTQDTIVIWVGDEVQEFYQGKADEYIEQYNNDNTRQYLFPHEIEVRAQDTGTAAGVFLDDPAAGPDILTVAHDNLGRLTSGASAIFPIFSQDLMDQIAEQNPESFLNVIKADYEGTEYIFGVPYEAQALILYYNKAYLTETDVETWEGIWDVAKTMEGTRATSVTGIDGFNNSFLVLSSFVESGEMPVRIYENGQLANTEFVNDAMVSVMKWGQRFFSDPSGADEPSDSGWEVELTEEKTLSVIGGAWHFNAAQAALGDDLGVTVLPTYTLSEEDAYGSITAGTEMQSGTFADTKMFVMNKRSGKLAYLEELLLFLTHKDVQEESFLENGSLPAYKNALTEFEGMDGEGILTQLAVSQIAMFEHGIPQPFGVDARFNFYYYQKQGPEMLFEMLTDPVAFNTDAKIVERMEVVESIWLNTRE